MMRASSRYLYIFPIYMYFSNFYNHPQSTNSKSFGKRWSISWYMIWWDIFYGLTHWGRVMHICVGKLTIIGSDNGLSPQRRQTIIWTNAGMLLIGTLGTNFSEILIEIQTFSLKKICLKTSSAKWRPSCLGLNELKQNRHNSTANALQLRLFFIKPLFLIYLSR